MGMTDPVADMITRIRNGSKARRKWVDIPASKLKREVARILAEEHFINNYRYIEDRKQGEIRVFLKYGNDEKPVIRGIKRVSKPGLRIYSRAEKLHAAYPYKPGAGNPIFDYGQPPARRLFRHKRPGRPDVIERIYARRADYHRLDFPDSLDLRQRPADYRHTLRGLRPADSTAITRRR